ncbi:hypothetical protein B0H66DRAFT_34228 [Apodospora peruviana]|uniref:Uncharacterized protein n=1 Tax=Apodospora peruviana TaxID=516989 RepID=A0AAE0IRF5_9PEZI|nr:hypothetical protein B0H66DRAFT_34228 [Apodospora peruviana]
MTTGSTKPRMRLPRHLRCFLMTSAARPILCALINFSARLCKISSSGCVVSSVMAMVEYNLPRSRPLTYQRISLASPASSASSCSPLMTIFSSISAAITYDFSMSDRPRRAGQRATRRTQGMQHVWAKGRRLDPHSLAVGAVNVAAAVGGSIGAGGGGFAIVRFLQCRHAMAARTSTPDWLEEI